MKFNSKNVIKFINKEIKDLKEERESIQSEIKFTEKRLGVLKADKAHNEKLLEKLEGLR